MHIKLKPKPTGLRLLVRTVHMSMLMTVCNCGRPYSTE